MKTKTLTLSALALSIALSIPARAQQPAGTTRLLLPLNLGVVHGLYGTAWRTDMAVTNMGDADVLVLGLVDPNSCHIPEGCFDSPATAHGTELITNGRWCGDPGGHLLYVPQTQLPDLAFVVRTREEAVDAGTWGTSVPVVREDGFFDRPFSLVDIPLGAEFRSTLRIYDVDPLTKPPLVRVRVYLVGQPLGQPDTLIDELSPVFFTPRVPGCAAVAEVFLWTDQTLPTAGRIRIQIDPLDGKKAYWAFVSVTHNETQHATVITP